MASSSTNHEEFSKKLLIEKKNEVLGALIDKDLEDYLFDKQPSHFYIDFARKALDEFPLFKLVNKSHPSDKYKVESTPNASEKKKSSGWSLWSFLGGGGGKKEADSSAEKLSEAEIEKIFEDEQMMDDESKAMMKKTKQDAEEHEKEHKKLRQEEKQIEEEFGIGSSSGSSSTPEDEDTDDERRSEASEMSMKKKERPEITSIGDCIYVMIDLFDSYMRSSITGTKSVVRIKEKEKNMREAPFKGDHWLKGFISYFFVSKTDRTFEEALYSDLFMDPTSDNYKEQANIALALVQLDPPEKIYQTVKQSEKFEDLPERYKKMFHLLSKVFISSKLSAYFKFGSIESSDLAFFSVFKQMCLVCKPIFSFTNPISFTYIILNYALFSPVGKFFVSSLMRVTDSEKEIVSAKKKLLETLKKEKNSKSAKKCLKEFEKYMNSLTVEEKRKNQKKFKYNEPKIDEKQDKVTFFDYNSFAEEVLSKVQIGMNERMSFSDQEKICFMNYFNAELILAEKRAAVNMFTSKKFKKDIYTILDYVLPPLKALYNEINLIALFDFFIDAVIDLQKLVENDKKLKAKKVPKEEREKEWDSRIEKMIEKFSTSLFEELKRFVKKDEAGEQFFIRLVKWIKDKRKLLENNYLDVEKLLKGSKTTLELETNFFMECKRLAAILFPTSLGNETNTTEQ